MQATNDGIITCRKSEKIQLLINCLTTMILVKLY